MLDGQLSVSPPARSSSTGASRPSSLAALMNPEPPPSESEAEAEAQAVADEYEVDVDDDEGDEGDSEGDEISAVVSAPVLLVRPPSHSSLPSSVSALPEPIPASSKPSSSVKPRSKKPRSPSPSPPPNLPAPPFTTIRLDIELGGPDRYEVDVSQMAKVSGQRPPTPPSRISVAKHVVSESEPDTDGGKRKKRRKNPATENYDVQDPFIDDSELALDERTYFAQTKQQGFYVSSGEVALLKDKTPKKPKSKNTISLASAINATNGSAVKQATDKEEVLSGAVESSTKPGDEQGDETVGQKRKRYITVVENGKKRKVVDQSSFHPELQASIEHLKEAIKAENWSQKGKFPPNLKSQLSNLALQAIKLDEYDEHFFSLMPVLFPYNKFTMTKLIKRTVFADHTTLLHDRQEELLKELKALTDEGFQKAEEEWEKSVLAWDRRQEKAKHDQTDSAAPTRHPTEEMEVDTVAGQQPDAESKDGEKWSRRLCYSDGWMNSGHISREVSIMKKKYEKETMEGED
ncbi:hypothetical protein Agabi119p4_8287 [Agaricus bisporus var. burnettii]|uniref:Ubinuclein middle domain-containing protein n=1 Tax=Agaricus bisporus var. burnettii TaxID=192524 RepID=A0A8H7C6U4_AGABI|nr:hypothetical protein Agabi119p4_8287 [Agaricus bisporus var. burnettii]